MRHLVAPLLLCSAACSAPAPSPQTPANPPPAAPHHGAAHQHGFHKDFSDAEAFSTAFDDPARDAWQRPKEVLDRMAIPPGSVVADLGAGTGYFVAALAERVGPSGTVLALDVEPKMIEFLERRVREQNLPNVKPTLVRADDPGLSPGSVARVLCVNTWHHIDDRANYARKLAGGLTPEGEIWIVDFTLDARRGPPAEYRLAAERVVGELEQGGLRAEVIEPESLPDQYLVRARR